MKPGNVMLDGILKLPEQLVPDLETVGDTHRFTYTVIMDHLHLALSKWIKGQPHAVVFVHH